MRRIICGLLVVLTVVGSANAASAALRDNWLIRLMEKRLNENFRKDQRRINSIVDDIKAAPKGKAFAEKEGPRDALALART